MSCAVGMLSSSLIEESWRNCLYVPGALLPFGTQQPNLLVASRALASMALALAGTSVLVVLVRVLLALAQGRLLRAPRPRLKFGSPRPCEGQRRVAGQDRLTATRRM
jgi:hypothetical protein